MADVDAGSVHSQFRETLARDTALLNNAVRNKFGNPVILDYKLAAPQDATEGRFTNRGRRGGGRGW